MKRIKQKKITFLLPIKNRPKELLKLLKNCKKVFLNLNYFFLIIDASDKKNHLKNLKILKKYKNIKIFRQKSKGIQRGCIEGINHIKTRYASFLYDDDVMGDHITKIYMNNISKDKVFSFGYGIVKDIKETVKFKNLSSIQISKEDMISYYYGGNLQEEFKKVNLDMQVSLPVSPICTSFKTSFLYKWKNVLNSFVKKNYFRNYFFFEKEVGPDLLTFLMSVGNSKNYVNFFYPFAVKFSSHPNSISIIYGNSFLRIGYWLARICYFELKAPKDQKKRNYAYTYLISIGFFILITNLFNRFYFRNTLIEIYGLMKNKKNNFSFNYFLKIILRKFF